MEKKLAHQLRDVTEATARLYGNDLQIAERLLSRLLTFETQQSGFGLTATQDAHFNEVKRRIHNVCLCLLLCFPLQRPIVEQIKDMFVINKGCLPAVMIHCSNRICDKRQIHGIINYTLTNTSNSVRKRLEILIREH